MCKVGACSCGASATSSKLGETKNLLHTMGITRNYIFLPVVPGQAGGGSFQKEKNYIAQKEFAYRMCAW